MESLMSTLITCIALFFSVNLPISALDTTRTIPPPEPEPRLVGPAYKNRRSVYRPISARTYRYRVRPPQLTGPRWKNRGSKSRGSQH